jgi:uncharacterized membrane protein YdjX (TVP38/TMEM64 family)
MEINRATIEIILIRIVVLSTLLIVLGGFVFSAYYFIYLNASTNSAEMFVETIKPYGLVGSLFVMTVAALTAFPAELAAMACGAMYGPWLGSVVAWSTAMFGASVGYAIGRLLGRKFVLKMIGAKRYETMCSYASRDVGTLSLFTIRLIPLIPFFLVNYAAGLAGMRYPNFLLATGIGIIPGVTISTALGDSMAAQNWTAVVYLSVIVVVLTAAAWYFRRHINSTKSS